MRMNVLCITNLYPNGQEPTRATYNRQQFRELSKRARVRIVAPVSWIDRLFFIKEGRSIPYEETQDGLRVYHPTYFYPPRILRSLYGVFYLSSIFLTVMKIRRKFKPDYIFATWAYPDGFASVWLSVLFQCPVYIKVHGSDIHSMEGRLRKALTTWALNRSSKVFSVSDDLKQQIMGLGVAGNKIATVYNGIDHATFFPQDKEAVRRELNIHKSRKIILFVGHLKAVKNVDILINSYAVLRRNRDDTSLYIIGNGPLECDIRNRCIEQGIDSDVFFLGNVKHADIAKWMGAADCLVLPSQKEGVPNVILEAGACGVPVVATRVGGIPEIVRDRKNGLLVEPGSVEDLWAKMDWALDFHWNPGDVAGSGKSHSWQSNVDQILGEMERSF